MPTILAQSSALLICATWVYHTACITWQVSCMYGRIERAVSTQWTLGVELSVCTAVLTRAVKPASKSNDITCKASDGPQRTDAQPDILSVYPTSIVLNTCWEGSHPRAVNNTCNIINCGWTLCTGGVRVNKCIALDEMWQPILALDHIHARVSHTQLTDVMSWRVPSCVVGLPNVRVGSVTVKIMSGRIHG